MKKIVFFLIILLSCPVLAKEINIVSEGSTPNQYVLGGGFFSRAGDSVVFESDNLSITNRFDNCSSVMGGINSLKIKKNRVYCLDNGSKYLLHIHQITDNKVIYSISPADKHNWSAIPPSYSPEVKSYYNLLIFTLCIIIFIFIIYLIKQLRRF